jgi:hypothetical protein
VLPPWRRTRRGDPVGELQAQAPGKTPALDQFTTCLTAARAKARSIR